MHARVAHVTMFVMVTSCLVVAGTRTATAQALCPQANVRNADVEIPLAPYAMTLEADLRALGDTPPGGTWRMPVSGGIASDGLALEGVSFTRNDHTVDVVVDLRASDNLAVDLDFVVVDGERSLRLGAITEINIGCQALSVSRKFSISDHDFASFFAAGRAPTLRLKRTTRVGGC